MDVRCVRLEGRFFIAVIGEYPFLEGVHRTSVGLVDGGGRGFRAVILQLREVLRGVSPLIWRPLRVPSDTSIAQLHEIFQVAFG